MIPPGVLGFFGLGVSFGPVLNSLGVAATPTESRNLEIPAHAARAISRNSQYTQNTGFYVRVPLHRT